MSEIAPPRQLRRWVWHMLDCPVFISGSRMRVLGTFLVLSGILLAACTPRVNKINLGDKMRREVRVGLDVAEVGKYLQSLEVNGVKPNMTPYVRSNSPYTVPGFDGKETEAVGSISASFNNGLAGRGWGFCPEAFVIFYFDQSDKLVRYVVDC